MTLLQDPEWGQWSDSQIARQCFVHQSTVSRIRSSLMQSMSDKQERTYKTKHGTIAKMNTAKIGRKKASSSSDAEGDWVEVVGESTSTKPSGFPEMSQSNPVPPQKVEVNTDDILIAFISNLDCMSEAQLVAAVKAIAQLNPDLIRQVMASELKSEVSPIKPGAEVI